MKRFLALFAVVAIIGSMFAGVAMAEDAVVTDVAKEDMSVTAGTDVPKVAFTATDGEATFTSTFKVDDKDDKGVVTAADVTVADLGNNNGLVSLSITPVAEATDVTYTMDEEDPVDVVLAGDLVLTSAVAKESVDHKWVPEKSYTHTYEIQWIKKEVGEDDVVLATQQFDFNYVNENTYYYIELTKDTYIDDSKTVTINGHVFDIEGAYSSAYDKQDVKVDGKTVGYVDGNKIKAVVASDVGRFEVKVVGHTDTVPNPDVVYDDLETTFDIMKGCTLDSELEYDYPVKDFVVIEGNIDTDDNPIIYLRYKDGAPFADAEANNDGDFVMAFNGELEFDRAGDLELYMIDANNDELVLVKGEVKAQSLTVELSNNEFPIALLDEPIEINLKDLDSKYTDAGEDDLTNDYYYIVEVEDEDEKAELVSATEQHDIKEFKVWDKDDLNALAKGTYKVTVKLYEDDGDKLIMKGSTEFDVVSASGYVLTGWYSFDELTVGPKNMILGDTLKVCKDGEALEYYAISLDGAGINDKLYHNLDKADVKVPSKLEDDGKLVENDTVEIKSTHAGEIAITIDAYEVDGKEYDLVKSYEKVIKVTGYSVEVNLEEVLVKDEYELTIVVTDEDGNPVNNAYIYFVDEDGNYELKDGNKVPFVNPTSTNIVAGTYTDDEWKWETVEELDIEVYDLEIDDADKKLMTSLSDKIEVVGEETFVVDAEIDTLIAGNEEEITLTIEDENGDPYFPTKNDVKIVEDGSVTDIGKKVDLDDDSVKESIKVTVLVDHDADETIKLRVTDNEGADQGEFMFNVVKPEIQLDSAAVLTENFKCELSFTIVDPRDGSVIEEPEKVTFEATDVDCDDDDKFENTWYDDDKDELENMDASESESIDVAEDYNYYVKVSGIDWDAAEDDEAIPALTVKVQLSDDASAVKVAEIPFGKATLTADPEAMVMGTTNIITLTYADANGNVLEEYDIDLDDDKIGETDENGQVVYSAASVSTTGLTFEAETDVKDVVTEKKVKSSIDMEAPVITAPAEVNVPQVTVTVTDNVRVSAVRVNGNFLSIFPLATVTETVALEEGVNTIQIEAMDINNNATMQVLTVTYAKPVAPTPDVELQVGEATEFGTPELVNGSTMVPVRFATKLGASMAWDNATKTVTYTLGDTVISMTNGSTTAIVNGENVELTQAPFINDQNYTMVPLRMIAQELGFQVVWTSNDAPIGITK